MGATAQTFRISLYFFLLFTPYSSYMTILTHIYEDSSLPGIGPATLACNYSAFMLSTLCAPVLTIPIKMQLLLGGIFYTINYSTGFFVSFIDLGWLKFVLSCSGAFIAGLSGGPMWVSQGRYIHLACQKYGELNKKGQMFGIFSTLYCFSNVTAGLITTFGLGFFDSRTYFVIITIFGVIAILFCIFFIRPIEDIPSHNQNSESLMQSISNQSVSKEPSSLAIYSPKETLINVFKFFPKMKMVLLILVIDGVSLGIYSSEIPHLIFSDADKSEINKLAGYLMIALGAGATIGGLILGKIGDRKSTLFTGRLGLVLTVLGSALFALTIELKLYYLAVITAFQWGFFLFFVEGWMYLVCSRHFGGKAEAFSVNKQLHSLFYLIFQLSILPSGNKIPLLPVMGGLVAITVPAFFLINYIPVDYQEPSRT